MRIYATGCTEQITGRNGADRTAEIEQSRTLFDAKNGCLIIGRSTAQMSKYCIYQDRPLRGLASGEQDIFDGCVIFGVQHHCKGCPNCIEMGDEPYSVSATANPPTFGPKI